MKKLSSSLDSNPGTCPTVSFQEYHLASATASTKLLENLPHAQ